MLNRIHLTVIVLLSLEVLRTVQLFQKDSVPNVLQDFMYRVPTLLVKAVEGIILV